MTVDLVTRARDSDVGAFDALVGPRIERTVRTAMAILGSEAAAREATQSALAAIWRQLPTLREPARFAVWADRILIGRCRSHLSRGGTLAVHETVQPATPVAPGHRGPQARRQALEVAFGRLDPDGRALLVLHHLDQLPLVEIAARLDISLAAATARLQHARQRGDVRDMLVARAARADPSGMRAAAVSAARATPQVRRWRGRLPSPSQVSFAGLVVVLLGVSVVALVLWRPTPQAVFGGVWPSASATPSPFDTLFNRPPVSGSGRATPTAVCPVTPLAVVNGQPAPEAVESGVRWRWGGDTWQADVSQAVTVLPLAAGTSPKADEVLAERLWLGSSVPGTAVVDQPSSSVVYPISGRRTVGSETVGIGLPASGCWLLSLIGPDLRSSVVVDAAPAPAHPPDPAKQHVPTLRSPLVAPSTCPVSRQQTPASVLTWLDGAVSWQDPAPSPWLPGEARKLVLSGTGNDQPPEALVAARVGTVAASRAFVESAPAIATPVPGGGAKAALLALPTLGCWAITYVDPTMTSIIVVELP